MITIDEDSEDDTIADGFESSRDSEDGSSEDSDEESKVKTDEESGVNNNSDEASTVNSGEESIVNSDEESKVTSDEESKVTSVEESEVTSDEESKAKSDEESGVDSNEKSHVKSESKLENDDESQATNGEDNTLDSLDGNDHGSRSKNSPESDEQGSDTENESDDHTEKISLRTSNESTIKTINSNKENEWLYSVAISPSIISSNEETRSIISVNGQSVDKSVGSTPAKLPLKQKFINDRVAHLQLDSSGNKFCETMKKPKIVSSTPYKNQDLSKNFTADIEKSSTAEFSGSQKNVNRSSQDISNNHIAPTSIECSSNPSIQIEYTRINELDNVNTTET